MKKHTKQPENEQKLIVGSNAPTRSLASQKSKRLVLFTAIVAVVLAIALLVVYFIYARQAAEVKPQAQKSIVQQQIDDVRVNNAPGKDASNEEKAAYANTLGSLYVRDKQYQKGVEHLLEAEKLYTTDNDKYGAWVDLAGAYEAMGDKKRAVEYYKKVLAFAEKSPDADESTAQIIQNFKNKISELEG